MNRKQANMRYDMEAQGITELTEFLFFTEKKLSTLNTSLVFVLIMQ